MFSDLFYLVWLVIKIVFIIVVLLVSVLFITFLERKVFAYCQQRVGPNRVGPKGLLQPIADAIKMLNKQIILPSAANRYLFVIAPILTVIPAISVWAVIPFDRTSVISNISAGVLFLFAMSSLGIYGILVAGWSSNSKYALFGALRAAAQVISYEIPIGFSLVGVLLAASSMNLQTIILKQAGGFWHWYWLPLLPLMLIFWISSLVEINRLPFDVSEGEAELVAGFHVEYSGMTFALFYLGEYMNLILISTMVSILFLGGWLSPFQNIPLLDPIFSWIPGIFWLFFKISCFIILCIWIRATFPRYRYDQIMHIGWKIFIPVSLLWVVIVGFAVYYKLPPWFG